MATVPCGRSLLAEDHFWILRLMQGDIDAVALASDCSPHLTTEDAQILIKNSLTGRLGLRNRAVAAAAHLKGIPTRSISPFFKLNRSTVSHYCRRVGHGGVRELFDLRRKEIKTAEDPSHREAVFKILPAPPMSFGFNRTTWKMSDIRLALKKQRMPLSAATVRTIIRNAGFRFRKARKVLTSTDPDYRQKLQGKRSTLTGGRRVRDRLDSADGIRRRRQMA